MNRVILIYIVLPVVAFATGGAIGYLNRPAPEVQIQTVEKVVDRIVQGEERVRVVLQDRIVTRTVIQQPDGTVVTEERDESMNTESTRETEIVERTEDRQSSTSVSKGSPGGGSATSRYSLGISYWPKYSDFINDFRKFSWERAEFRAGVRVLGPAWLDMGIRQNELGLGIRWEF